MFRPIRTQTAGPNFAGRAQVPPPNSQLAGVFFMLEVQGIAFGLRTRWCRLDESINPKWRWLIYPHGKF